MVSPIITRGLGSFSKILTRGLGPAHWLFILELESPIHLRKTLTSDFIDHIDFDSYISPDIAYISRIRPTMNISSALPLEG